MWPETIAAALFLVGLWPVWFFVGLGWGAIKGVIVLVVALISLLDNSFDAENLLAIPVVAALEAASAAWSVPSWVWEWAKFNHPWIAAIIGFVGLTAQAQK